MKLKQKGSHANENAADNAWDTNRRGKKAKSMSFLRKNDGKQGRYDASSTSSDKKMIYIPGQTEIL